MRSHKTGQGLPLVFVVLLSTASMAQEEQEIYLQHSMRMRREERASRLLVENEFVEAAVVRELVGGETKLFPGLRSSHVKAGSLSPEGSAAVAGSGHFAGYAAGYELGDPGISVDFGLDPVNRRGIAVTPFGNSDASEALFYWLRKDDEEEFGGFYSFHAGDFFAVDLGLMRNRFFSEREPDLSAERLHIGRSEEMLKGLAGLRAQIPWVGSVTLLGASSLLPSLPPGAFLAASLSGEHLLCGYSAAGDYSSRFYVYRDGDVAEGRWNGSFELSLLPRSPIGGEVGAVIRDGGVELSPDLYRETEHEMYGGFRIGLGPLQFEAERGLEWWWETDGEGGYEDRTELSLELETGLVSAELYRVFGEQGESVNPGGCGGTTESCGGTEELSGYGGELELDLFHVRASAEAAREDEELSYAFGLEADIGGFAELAGRFGLNDGESFWSISWNVGGELVLPGDREVPSDSPRTLHD